MLVSVKEYAKIVGKKESTIRSVIRYGDLPSFKQKNGRQLIDSETPYPYDHGGKPTAYKHGLSNHKLRNTWSCMKQRCYNKNNPSYNGYGAKGITVCDEWRDNLPAFVEWAENNGYVPGLTIDRIDSSKGYFPENCRWLTRSENSKHAVMDTYLRKCKYVNMDIKQNNNFKTREEAEIADITEKLLQEKWCKANSVVYSKTTIAPKRYAERKGSKICKLLFVGFAESLFDECSLICGDDRYCVEEVDYDYTDTPDKKYIERYIKTVYF